MTNILTPEQSQTYLRTGMLPDEMDKHRQAIEKGVKRDEKRLQKACEGLCEQRGYRRLVGPRMDSVLRDTSLKGFHGHVTEARKNAFMPDLFIYDLAGRCLLVELKVSDKYQPGQKEMIDAGLWVECRTPERFGEVLSEWETER